MPCFTTEDLLIKSRRSHHKYHSPQNRSKPQGKTVLFSIIILILSNSLNAQNIGYYNPDHTNKFFFKTGIGYGVANNPITGQHDNNPRGGITLNASLGHRFNERFSIGFGPSFWIEGQDILDNSASNNEVPSNKRTLVTLDGYYQLFQKLPLQIRLGAGIGSMVYTPNQKVVSSDNNGISKTEITNGFAAVAGLIYRIRVAQKFDLYPSLNFNYGKLEPQKIPYASLINHHKASLVADLRISTFIFF